MKLKRDKSTYPLKPISRLEHCIVRLGPSDSIKVMMIHPKDMDHMKSKDSAPVLGIPVFLALRDGDTQIEFYPSPDKDYNVSIFYLPPMLEQ